VPLDKRIGVGRSRSGPRRMQLRRRQHRRGARGVRPPARDQVPIQNRNHNATRGIGVDAASTMSTIAQNAIASVAHRGPRAWKQKRMCGAVRACPPPYGSWGKA